jgi:hypothetical protein
MFGRRKKQLTEEAPAASEESLDRVDPVESANIPLSAVEAFALVRPIAEQYGDDARMYLVLSADVNPSGLAPTWEFHYIYQERHAEGRFTSRTGAASTSGEAQVHTVVTPFPVPGTPEHTMVQSGGYMITIVEQAWQARLDRIMGLPTEFHDSTEAVEEMKQQGHPLFSGGPLRMKGRTLPSGSSVWEAVTAAEVVHTPFGFDRR